MITGTKLHLGSGNIRLEGWVNIDIESEQADVKLDLREQLPFADGSADFIFAEHFIEHVTREDGVSLLRECARVLRPEGVLRLSTPNLKWLVAMYVMENVDEWDVLWRPDTPCQLLNQGMRSWGHEFVYDKRELFSVLAEAGFATVREVPWRDSSVPELKNLENRPFHRELIIEAVR